MAEQKVLEMLDRIQVLTHSSIRIEDGPVIYCDPFQIPEAVHDADLVFVTHSHYDHYSLDDIDKVRKAETKIVVPQSMLGTVRTDGFLESDIVTMTPGEEMEIDGIRVEAVASYNILKPFHGKMAGWVGYVFTIDGCRIYVSGDMDATPEAKAVQCDIAMIPVGGTYTMDVGRAAEYINELRPQAVIPTHYGNIVGKPEDGELFQRKVDDEIHVELKLKF